MKAIPIVLVCDDAYAMPTAVAITSMIDNCNRGTSYDIRIFGNSLSEENKKLLSSFKTNSHTISIHDISMEGYSEVGNSSVPTTIHVSKTALCKFDIANLLSEYDKAIYIDGDVIVKKDLKALFSIELGDKYAAVVKDMKPMVHYKIPQTVKLGVNHSAYFNTGVMLLNLKKMRLDRMDERLLNYRANGINNFMDQDAFNAVFEENVIYLDFTYNMIYSDYEFFKFLDLKSYYGFSAKSSEKLIEDTVVLHLSSKEKPWLYYDMQFSEEWYKYYLQSPYASKKLARKSVTNMMSEAEVRKEYREIFNELSRVKSSFSYRLGCKITEIPRAYLNYRNEKKAKNVKYTKNWKYNGPAREKKIIVSFTSFPDRMEAVPRVIESLMKQTVKPDEIVLYLSSSQFEGQQLSNNVKKAKKYDVKIKFCDDLKPHKKYFFVMKEYPDDIIITVDDDVIYPTNLLEKLYESYERHPDCVSAGRVHKISFDSFGKMLPYNSWEKEYQGGYDKPSMALMATGIGGVLYPPKSIPPEAFDKEKIEKTCLFADDLWLKIMEVKKGTRVVSAFKNKVKLPTIEKTQNNALWTNNVDSGGNDVQMERILSLDEVQRFEIIEKIRTEYLRGTYQCDYLNENIHPGDELTSISELNGYLKHLNKIKSEIIIVMFVNDTAEKYWSKIKFPGSMYVKKRPKFRSSYVNICDFGDEFHSEIVGNEKCSANYLCKSNGLNFEVTSRGYSGSRPRSFVKYQQDEKTYMYSIVDADNRGLYLFIFSKEAGKPLDFIRVDVHKDEELNIIRFKTDEKSIN